MAIVRYTREEIEKMPSLTNWERLKNMTDEDIDFSDIPEWTDEMFAKATRGGVPPETPKKVTIYVSSSLLDGFRRTAGRNWRNRLSNGVDTWLRKEVVTE